MKRMLSGWLLTINLLYRRVTGHHQKQAMKAGLEYLVTISVILCNQMKIVEIGWSKRKQRLQGIV